MFDRSKLVSSNNEKKPQRILIVDGTNNLIRAACIAQSYNSNKYTVFLKTIGTIISKIKPSQCYIVFDGEGGNMAKRKLFMEYKTNRKGVSKIQTQDYLQLFQILKYAPLITIRMNNVQGDDVIGHIVINNQTKGNKIVICSSDKDFYQLTDQNTQIWDPIKKVFITNNIVIQKYNCHPINFPILKSLMGDASDNIPGIKGLGQKTVHKYFPNLFEEAQPLNGDMNIFKEYVQNMETSDMKFKILQQFTTLKNYYKIVNLRNGCFLTPQIGSLIQESINNKINNLQFNKPQFIQECKKNSINLSDLIIIYPAFHLISRR